MREFIEEVKRRNVFKVAVVYLFAAWLTMQVVDVMFEALLLPDWLGRAVAAGTARSSRGSNKFSSTVSVGMRLKA